MLQFYAMVNFCNPGLLGTPSQFRRYYEAPVLAGREPDATELQQALGQERSQELSASVNEFILRRTNTILSDHLPPKVGQRLAREARATLHGSNSLALLAGQPWPQQACSAQRQLRPERSGSLLGRQMRDATLPVPICRQKP